jgi:hypothetical protein
LSDAENETANGEAFVAAGAVADEVGAVTSPWTVTEADGDDGAVHERKTATTV